MANKVSAFARTTSRSKTLTQSSVSVPDSSATSTIDKVGTAASVNIHTGNITQTVQKVSATASAVSAYGDFTLDGKAPARKRDDKSISTFRYTHDTLELDIRSPRTKLDDLRAYNPNTGDIEQIVNSDGGWVVIDRSLSGANITVSPPRALVPVFIEDTYYLQGYSESQVDDLGKTVDVTFRLVRDSPRDPENPDDVLVQTAASDEWLLEFSHGTIATDLIFQKEEQGQKDIDVGMTVTLKQAEVIMESATRVGAVSVETVPDGDDFVRDNNQNDRNTITVTRPNDLSDDYLPTEGDYVVRDWSLERYLPFKYRVSMTIRKL